MSRCEVPLAIALRTLLRTAVAALLCLAVAPCLGGQEQLPANDAKPRIAQADATQIDVAQDDATQTQTQPQNPPPSQAPAAKKEDEWHVAISPYLWFPGLHGTVGALNRNTSVHASAGDLLSNFRFGIMGAAEAEHGGILLNGDLMWIRLGDDRAVPFPRLGAVSADVRVGELIWTSKVGARLVDKEKFKGDMNVGVRFWHLGQKINFNPSLLGLNFKASENWADLVLGGRTETALSPKVSVIVLGDVGGWGTGSQLEYQFASLLGYKFRDRWTLGVGYRYLFVDYRTRQFLYNTVTSGVIFGLTYKWK